MFINFQKQCEQELKKLHHLKKLYAEEMADFSDCNDLHLASYTRGDKTYYTSYATGHRTDRKYAGTAEAETVKRIQKAHFLSKSLSLVQNNISQLEKLMSKYTSVHPSSVASRLAGAYKGGEHKYLSLLETIDVEEWRCQHPINYDQERDEYGNLNHITSMGHKVRSKSEVVIANALASHDVPYVYEEERYFNSHSIAPDFIVLSPLTNEEIIWEHFGLMHDEKYRQSFVWKMEQYIAAGYYPNVNLITTFDDKNGGINSQMVDAIIANFLLC